MKSDRERKTLYSITYMWSPKNYANDLISRNRKRLRDIENKLKVPRGWGKGQIIPLYP